MKTYSTNLNKNKNHIFFKIVLIITRVKSLQLIVKSLSIVVLLKQQPYIKYF